MTMAPMPSMPQGAQRNRWIFVAILILMVTIDTLVIRGLPFQPLMTYGLLFDFALLIPVLYWLLVLRSKGSSALKALQLLIPALAFTWFILPPEGRGELTAQPAFKGMLVLLEAGFITLEVMLVVRVIRRFRALSKEHRTTAEALRLAILGKQQGVIAAMMTNEVLMGYYLLFSWGRRNTAVSPPPGTTQFSYHRQSNIIVLAAVLSHILLFEAFGMHMLVQLWSHIAAWVLTALDVWCLLLIWADVRAAVLQPLEVSSEQLRIRYGMRLQADVPLEQIRKIEYAREFEVSKEEQRQAVTTLTTPNVRIELVAPQTVQSLMFKQKTVQLIYLTVDEPQALVEQVQSYT